MKIKQYSINGGGILRRSVNIDTPYGQPIARRALCFLKQVQNSYVKIKYFRFKIIDIACLAYMKCGRKWFHKNMHPQFRDP